MSILKVIYDIHNVFVHYSIININILTNTAAVNVSLSVPPVIVVFYNLYAAVIVACSKSAEYQLWLGRCDAADQERLGRRTDVTCTAAERCVSTEYAWTACPTVPTRPPPGYTRSCDNVPPQNTLNDLTIW